MRWFLLALVALGLACPAPVSAPPPVTPHVATTTTPPPAAPVDAPAATADAPAALAPAEPALPALRLPKTFVPVGYEAELAIDPGQPTFSGTITIAGELKQRSTVIWLDGRHLQVAHAEATRASDRTTVKLTVAPRGEDLLELTAETPLDEGAWQLQLQYTGEIDRVNTAGAFEEKAGGAPYVFSQLEAIYARRVFPCVDEPDSKVPWQLTLVVPEALVAVSNAPEISETPLPGGKKRVAFAPTKPLPSYLVAFGVGPFDIVDAGKTKSGTPVRVIALHGRGAEAAWAAKTAPRVVELLEEWFGMPYPYDKLDLLTIPLTVGFGAMENAGLVTYTEALILMDPAHASWARKHRWIVVASHELAHQWFGDYVTTAWWDDLWLNEGFANWMENKIAALYQPAWHDELATLSHRESALAADSLVSARRIRQPIESEGDIYNVFDAITYDKGAAVLAMFEHYVGADAFQRGVREYLKAHAYGNATASDLVSAIDAATGKDLAAAFATFLDQPGAPDVQATLACRGGTPALELAQSRYVPAGSPAPAAQQPWIFPVCVAYERAGKRAEACTMLGQPTGTLALDSHTCPRWVMPNVDARGYYRLRLTVPQVTALRDEGWSQLTWTERRELFFEVAEASRHGALPLQLALSFVPKMLTGGDRFTIGDALGLVVGVERFVPDELRAKYEAAMRALFTPGATKVGVLPKPSDDLDAESVRAQLFGAAAWHGREPALVQQAVDLAAHWRDLAPAMRGTILRVAADASPAIFDELVRDVKKEPDRIKRGEMLVALGAVRDPERLKQALALTLDRGFDFRESMVVLFYPSTIETRRVVEQFFREHEKELVARMPSDELSSSLIGTAQLFTGDCDAAHRDETAAYLTKLVASHPGGERVVKQELESMDQCIAQRASLEPELRAWLGGLRLPRPETKTTRGKK